MTRKTRVLTAVISSLISVLIAGAASVTAAPASVMAVDELQGMFDQGRYAQLMPSLNQSLADKATIAKADDHYKLLMLKGETMLRLKASGSAQDAFRAASLVVGADDNSVAIAKATASLIKRSGFSKYQPKAKAEGSTALQAPIDILAPDSRKQAFAALFTDLFAPAQPVVAAAEKATSLEPIVGAVPQLTEVRNVEIAATGSDAQTKELLNKLATHAADLLNTALKPMDGDLTNITKGSSKQTRGGSRSRGQSGTAGGGQSAAGALSLQNTDKLDSDVSEAREISSAAASFKTLFGDAGDFATIKTNADKIVTDGNKLLAKYKKATE